MQVLPTQRWLMLTPILAMVMLQSHGHFLQLRSWSAIDYSMQLLQLSLESLPFFIAHYIALHSPRLRKILVWLAGFVLYPLLVLMVSSNWLAYQEWQVLDVQTVLLCSAASVIWMAFNRTRKNSSATLKPWLQWLISLDGVVIVLMCLWSLMFAGILNSHEDPMLNQPFNLVIDLANIAHQFPAFAMYAWQMLVYALVCAALFLFNRYVLIRQILSLHGVLTFVSATLICILVLTPTLAALFISLPINDLPVGISNITPGGDTNIFNKYNYHLLLGFFALSTPIILTYERQQQHAQWHEAEKQQTQSELKLLQQQINPHFLFNTLNNLYALTLTKSDAAPESVMRLASLLRYTVYEGQKPNVTLQQEITYLQDFIALQKLRSGDKCLFECHWPEHSKHVQLAPLLLIIIIENAIKHGVEPATGPVTVGLNVALQGNQLHVRSHNPCHSGSQAGTGGMGLANLKRRLELLYPQRHQLTYEIKHGQWHCDLVLELNPC